jgi:alkylation response protein AidB-like acyl-CoA dehydrogenase
MSVNLTREQLMIQTMAREFSRKVVLRDAAERDRTKTFPADVLKRMGGLGLMGMRVPEAYGGQEADMVAYALALSEIAYACAATAVIMAVHSSIVCESIAVFGTPAQKERFLPPLAAGEMIGAFALTEPQAGSDPLRQETSARRQGGHYILNGNKRFITSGKNGGLIIVTAKTDPEKGHRGISAFLVPQGTAGLSVGRVEEKLGLRASDTVDLVFNDCRVPADHLLGAEGEGFKIAMTALDGGRIGIAAQSLGVAQAAFDEAVKYARSREQFGRKISKFQSIRFTLADMATEIEAARQLMLLAAAKKEQGQRVTREAAMAKLYASEMANRVTAKALQIHGGYGVTKDYPVERLYRDARVFTLYEGTSEIQRVVISDLLLHDKGK